jgi:hypothetical protein
MVVAAAVTLVMTLGTASAHDEARYPNWKGQWTRAPVPGVTAFRYGPPWDPGRPEALGQEAPLTDEYRANFEANLADQAAGGSGNWVGVTCRGHGLPAIMSMFFPAEFVILPDVTYIIANDVHVYVRRIFTDGRPWPERIEPAFLGGLSLGRWIDEDGDGRYDALEIETRGFKGPRAVDLSGIPLHQDNETIVKERIYLDKADPKVLHDQITIMDHAFTRPWTVTKDYRRNPNPTPYWPEQECAEGQLHVQVGSESFMVSGDGHLMPVKKGQAPPDLRYFHPRDR